MLKKLAFTLAEILIVVGIVGMVAEMTIPTLINNVNDQQYRVALKKNYSTLTQAMSLDQINRSVDAMDSSGATASNLAISTLAAYFKSTEVGTGATFGGSTIYCTDGKTSCDNISTYPAFRTADGSVISYRLLCNVCTYDIPYVDRGCGKLRIDINGSKPPNTLGKDVYTFILYLLPNGGSDYAISPGGFKDGLNCLNAGTTLTSSEGCAINVLMN